MFVENTGQFDPSIKFQVRGAHTILNLAQGALWLTTFQSSNQPHTFKLTFDGANPAPRVIPFQRLATQVSYFIGQDPEQWHPDVPIWGGVRYEELYPGIDLEIWGENGQLLWQMRPVRASANLSAVQLHIEGADQLTLEGDFLRLVADSTELTLPLLSVSPTNTTMPHRLGLARLKPTVVGQQVKTPFTSPPNGPMPRPAATLDPLFDLLYSTYLGGTLSEQVYGIAADANGNTYITGDTTSTNFAPSSFPPSGLSDMFVAKLNSTGSYLLYFAYIEGSLADRGNSIAVDANGNAYVTGWTESTNFPYVNQYDSTLNGGESAVVVRLNSTGTALTYSTYFSTGQGHGIALRSGAANTVYIIGQTGTNLPIKPNPGAFQTTPQGGADGFIAKFDTALVGEASLLYSTYWGGNNDDCEAAGKWKECAIAVDASGRVYLTGRTLSTNFPRKNATDNTCGTDGQCNNSQSDAFVSQLNLVGTGANDLLFSTYLGGPGKECYVTCAIAVDASQNIYVTGQVTTSGFPITANAVQPTWGGGYDAFVSIFKKLSGSVYQFYYSTYIGGNGIDQGFAIAVDGQGSAYVTGYTSTNFPTTPGAFQSISQGYLDAFVVKVNPGATSLVYSTHLGGNNIDSGNGIAIDPNGPAYVTGETSSTNFPHISTGIIYQDYLRGASDAFATKMAVPPVKAASYYVRDINTLGELGAQLGIHDRDTIGAQDNLVVLAFGNPARRFQQNVYVYGTELAFDFTFVPTADIITSSVDFIQGYQFNTGSDTASRLTLAIGTSNCCTGNSLAHFQGHGTAWGEMINTIKSQLAGCCKQVKVVAGNDIEIDFNYPYITTQWVNRYVAASQCIPGYGEAGCLYNFGAYPGILDGACATQESDTTWAKCDMWYVSWGVKKNSADPYTFARPLPEIYHADGRHAENWRDLSLYSVNTQNAGPMYFVGAFTQYARCQANPPGCIIGGTHVDNTPDKGWMQLWNALFSNPITRMSYLHWSTDIASQPELCDPLIC